MTPPPRTWETHDGFLRAIHEHPDEDVDRLVFADWLEEHGTEAETAWAEFIRSQIEVARLGNRSKHRRARLGKRQGELRARHERDWLGPWGAVPFRWGYCRGVPQLVARGHGAWIGKRLGQDWGFPDRITFDEQGRTTVDYGDINWPGVWPTVEGEHQVHFLFAEVRVRVTLKQVEKKTLRFEGTLTNQGESLELVEQGSTSSRPPQRVRLTLSALPESGG